MSVFLVTYDLMKPETSADYEDLIDQIKSYDAWAKPEYSTWLIKADKATKTVFDELSEHTDSNDKLLVVNITGDPWWSKQLPADVVAWMKNNI
jgi:hypothetical protein